MDEIPLPAGPGGRLWLCGKHFVAPDPEAALGEIDGDAVVCLNEADELTGRYPEYVRWLDANQPERALWWPIPDLHAPPLADAVELLGQLRARLASGQTLLVHCGAGIGRAGTVAAGLLMTVGLSLDEAVARVADHRPMAGPEAGAQIDLLQALSTPATGRPGQDDHGQAAPWPCARPASPTSFRSQPISRSSPQEATSTGCRDGGPPRPAYGDLGAPPQPWPIDG